MPVFCSIPRLSLRKTPHAFLLFLTAFFAMPAHAGRWVLHMEKVGDCQLTGSNDGNAFTPHVWTPPADSNGGISFGGPDNPTPRLGQGASSSNFDHKSHSMTFNATISVKITATWTSDTNSDNTTPPSVYIIETGSANASAIPTSSTASANDSLSDGSGGTSTTPQTTPPAHLTKETTSPFTFNRSLSASATGTCGPSDPTYSAGASIVSYSVTIHAQPYNLHQTEVVKDAALVGDDLVSKPGSMYFEYQWLSTSGSITDLTSCQYHERVTYPGTVGTDSVPVIYHTPSPFTDSYKNPTVSSDKSLSISGTAINDTHDVTASSAPYKNVNFSASQRYEFDDSVTGEKNTLIPGSDSTNTIRRAIGPRSPYSGWWYSCSKNSIKDWLQLQ